MHETIPVHEFGQAIEKGLEENQFLLYYQPELSIQTRRIEVVEALARWQVPGNTFPLEAGHFIPHAERTRKIVNIGNWVIREVLERARDWRLAGRNVRLSLNVSMRQVAFYEFVSDLSALIDQYGVDPSQIEIEITETARPISEEIMRSVFEQIACRGVRISLDDFGTAYSHMDYLLGSIPAHTIKIDAKHVRDLMNDPIKRSRFQRLIECFHDLGLEVVAEGVETDRQLRILKAIGCDRAQGYFIARPMPVTECEAFIDGWAQTGEHVHDALALSA